MLEIRQLQVHYGKFAAVQRVDLDVVPGQVTLVVGVNGAGKSTTLRTVAGLHPPTAGTVAVGGQGITRWPAHKVVRRGVVLVPEGRRVFAPLSVLENLRLGGYTAGRNAMQEALGQVFDLFPILHERRDTPAGLLSGGEQQMLAFGRALAASPAYMLLDEPSMGLAPAMFDVVLDSIRTMSESGIGILMVEQNAEASLELATRVAVLAQGEVAFSGDAKDLRANEHLLRSMLGEAALDSSG